MLYTAPATAPSRGETVGTGLEDEFVLMIEPVLFQVDREGRYEGRVVNFG